MRKEKFENIIRELESLLFNLPMTAMKKECKEPCTYVDISLERFFYKKNIPNRAAVTLHHNERVMVYTKVHSYNGFRDQL